MKLKLSMKLTITIMVMESLSVIVLMVISTLRMNKMIKGDVIDNLVSLSGEKGKQFDTKISDLCKLSLSISNDIHVVDFIKNIKDGVVDEKLKQEIRTVIMNEKVLNEEVIENLFITVDGIVLVDGVKGGF